MGYYQVNAKQSANKVIDSISDIDEICSSISSLAEYLSGDKNNFADEYINNYEEIINTLKKTKTALDDYASEMIKASIKVEREIEKERNAQKMCEMEQ